MAALSYHRQATRAAHDPLTRVVMICIISIIEASNVESWVKSTSYNAAAVALVAVKQCIAKVGGSEL